jgi:DNA-binding transcriptional MerR regulator
VLKRGIKVLVETSGKELKGSSVPGLKLRTADVARRAGCSVQLVRNLERDGVLPPAARTAAGHRTYGEAHLHSTLAYRALAVGVGPSGAKEIVRSVHRGLVTEVLARLDAAHAQLDAERAELRRAEQAARTISGEPITDVRPSDSMSVAELAAALGVRPSTLRHWDAEDLVVPDRDGPRGARRYTPSQVRDARIVHQLRLAGYRVPDLRDLMPRLRDTDISSALASRQASIAARSRALLEGAAALNALLSTVDSSRDPAGAPANP